MQATSELGEPGFPAGAGTAGRPLGAPGRRGAPVPLIAVVGGCGGAGASTLAVGLAVAALELGRCAVLFDADALGGGLDRLVAAATDAERREGDPDGHDAWPHDSDLPSRSRPGGRAPSGRLSLVAWALRGGGNIPVSGMRNALRELRDGTDLVVVDLPRTLDDAAQLALSEATHSLVIAPVSERAAVATARLLPKLTAVGPRPELVARLPARDDLTPREFADLLVLPLAGVVRPRHGRASAPPDPLSRLAGRSAVSLERFCRRFVERCESSRYSFLNAAGVAG